MAGLKEYYTVKLHDTDAAGILFYANQFKMAHDMYEQFLTRIGFALRERFTIRDFSMPIVHAEADYHQPLQVGDTIEIALSVEKIGTTSFSLKYQMSDLDGISVGIVQTVHVTIDLETGKKIKLPVPFREKLMEMAKKTT